MSGKGENDDACLSQLKRSESYDMLMKSGRFEIADPRNLCRI
jgi:hypothetical protein